MKAPFDQGFDSIFFAGQKAIDVGDSIGFSFRADENQVKQLLNIVVALAFPGAVTTRLEKTSEDQAYKVARVKGS
jgi:hypothetical protein